MTPSVLKALRNVYIEQIGPLQQDKIERAMLERKMSNLVNRAYHPTEEEIAAV
ncbi:hypothetical protein ccbrp13_61110 [Ktedonobacteria bacterium brp13]|nr:hypothetical protein ccbrp13_61110 [Ktedonobacteria bacterium brp13]